MTVELLTLRNQRTMTETSGWVSFTGLFCLIICVSVSEGLKCLACSGISSPELCRTVYTCGLQEVCYMRQRSVLGQVLWDLGCRDTMVHACPSTGKRAGPQPNDTESRDIRTGDVVMCDSCCQSDNCNLEGCGYTRPAGTICYNCNYASTPSSCHEITLCGQGQPCMISSSPTGSGALYRMECGHELQCRAIEAAYGAHSSHYYPCIHCCDQDFCNDDCTDSLTTTVTQAPTSSLATIALKTSGPFCYSCDPRNTPTPESCQTVVQCDVNQACFMDELSTLSGTLRYRFGCRDLDVCSGTAPVVGKRSGDLVTCSRCCQSDLCQKTLCGQDELKPRASRGPVCFNCVTATENGTCDAVTECSQDQACFQSFTLTSSNLAYQHGCVSSKICERTSVRKRSTCFKCCQDDLCNVGCHDYGSSATVATTVGLTSTTRRTTTITTTQKPSTAPCGDKSDAATCRLVASLVCSDRTKASNAGCLDYCGLC